MERQKERQTDDLKIKIGPFVRGNCPLCLPKGILVFCDVLLQSDQWAKLGGKEDEACIMGIHGLPLKTITLSQKHTSGALYGSCPYMGKMHFFLAIEDFINQCDQTILRQVAGGDIQLFFSINHIDLKFYINNRAGPYPVSAERVVIYGD